MAQLLRATIINYVHGLCRKCDLIIGLAVGENQFEAQKQALALHSAPLPLRQRAILHSVGDALSTGAV